MPFRNTGTSLAATVPAVTGMLGADGLRLAAGASLPKLCHQITTAAATRMIAAAPIARLNMASDSLGY